MYEIEEIIASADEDTTDGSGEDEDGSWILEPGTAAIKKTDRHVFLYREMNIPVPVQEFFGVEDLEPGQKRPVTLWHNEHRYDAFIEKTVHGSPRTRMLWKPDFAQVLKEAFPQWREFFSQGRKDAAVTPFLQFNPRPEPGHFEAEFDDTHRGGGDAEFEPPLQSGEVTDNETIAAIFRCSRQGAIRRSLSTNSLVLISDHAKSAYEDKWIGKIFHYTGMGLVGEQSLALQQNRILAESRKSGVRLWLFEVFHEGQYVFIGEVELTDSPYRSRQPDGSGNLCDVWIFALQRKGGKHPPVQKKNPTEPGAKTILAKPRKLPMDELEFQAKYALKEGGRRNVVTEVYESDRLVAEYARRRADGICQLCNRPAPFLARDGEPFLEVHHIVPLADGGPDAIGNIVALCPNCHRKMHELNLPVDGAILRKRSASDSGYPKPPG
jgi:5-methylcytosine-specific restriction protein A